MAVINPPSWLQAGTYTARMDRQVIDGIISTPGVTSATSFAIVPSIPAGMSVSVLEGGAYVTGSELLGQGTYHVFNEDTFDITIPPSNSVNPRIDLIYIRIYDQEIFGTNNMAVVEIQPGDPAISPVVPTLPASSIPLARVAVGAGVSSISIANITNLRPRAKFHSQLTRGLLAKPEAWHDCISEGIMDPAWTTLIDAVTQRPGYRRFNNFLELKGQVRLSAALVNNTNYTLFTLPAGFRPPLDVINFGYVSTGTTTSGAATAGTAHTHSTSMSYKPIRLNVNASGTVTLYVGHSTAAYGWTAPSSAHISLSPTQIRLS